MVEKEHETPTHLMKSGKLHLAVTIFSLTVKHVVARERLNMAASTMHAFTIKERKELGKHLSSLSATKYSEISVVKVLKIHFSYSYCE